MVGAGVFVADPMNGYPPGTPDGPPVAVSIGGIGHLVFGGLGFLCLVAGALLLARTQRSALAWFSRVTGVLFLVAFAGIASGAASPAVVLGFWAALLVVWVWLAVVSVDLYRRTPLLTPT